MDSDDPRLAPYQAQLAQNPTNETAVLGLSQVLVTLERPDAVIALARSMEAAGKPGLADRVLRSAARALPQHPTVAEAYCDVAEARGDIAEASSRWMLVRKFDPKRLDGHLGFIHFMVRQGRLDDAERAAMAALMALGNKPALNTFYARVAEMKGNWAEAASRWESLVKYHADHPDAADNARHAAERSAEGPVGPDGIDSPSGVIKRVRTVNVEALADLKKLLTGFESLGYNCEFGLLQREFKTEPLGLLRYSETPVPTLKGLLRTRFDGLGDPDYMSVVSHRNEFRLAHNLSKWTMHTKIAADGAIPAETVLRDGAKRIAFLRSKLIRDLERPSKIFVLQKADLTDAEIDEVFEGMQQYGPGMLMCVRLYDAAHPRGMVEWRSERLMVAAIDRIGNAFPGAGWDISADYWIHFCRIAQERWATLRPPVAA